MSDKDDARQARIPRLSIETDAPGDEHTDEAAAASRWEAASDAVRDAVASEDFRDAVGFVKGFGEAAWVYAKRHPFTVAYGFAGLVLAILILTIGLWDTIVIAVFMIVGAVIGQIRDGDNGIVNFFSRLFGRGR